MLPLRRLNFLLWKTQLLHLLQILDHQLGQAAVPLIMSGLLLLDHAVQLGDVGSKKLWIMKQLLLGFPQKLLAQVI